MHIDLSGKRVLVTAGASGIGRSIAEAFLSAGARVHVCDIAPAMLEAVEAANPGIGVTRADVSSVPDVARLFDDVSRELGGLDVLVNNAGIGGPTSKVQGIAPEDWDRVLSVNVNGMFYVTRLAVPLLIAAGGGVILNLSSIAGRLPNPLRLPYATSKAAILGFTQTLALELGPEDIRVNAILPGVVTGDRHRGNAERRAKLEGRPVEELEAATLANTALGRFIDPSEVAQLAVFLASDAAINISGQSMGVCGYFQGYVHAR